MLRDPDRGAVTMYNNGEADSVPGSGTGSCRAGSCPIRLGGDDYETTTVRGGPMSNPIVHAEIIGRDPDRLRAFYRELFGWAAEAGAPVAESVSAPDAYAFVDADPSSAAVPIGIGGGAGYHPRAIFYVGVANVPVALSRAVELGGATVTEPDWRPDGAIRVARFADPEGNVVGLAGPA
jgi:predicted enzyme related to lactoylglutathione lyase